VKIRFTTVSFLLLTWLSACAFAQTTNASPEADKPQQTKDQQAKDQQAKPQQTNDQQTDDVPLFKMGPGMTPPRATYQPQPEYSDQARKKKFQGTCLLEVVVETDGKPRDIRVTRPLGLGLDEQAIKAVKKMEFEPARKDGQPVAVKVHMEVTFHLY
jgi:TonB family protein